MCRNILPFQHIPNHTMPIPRNAIVLWIERGSTESSFFVNLSGDVGRLFAACKNCPKPYHRGINEYLRNLTLGQCRLRSSDHEGRMIG
jgi:hypothetical protein